MPGEQSPAECYHTYISSQRRVERWVEETGKELQAKSAESSALPAPAAKASGKQSLATTMEPVSLAADAVRPRSRHRTGPSSKDRTRTQDSRSRSRPSSGSKRVTSKVQGSSSRHTGWKEMKELSRIHARSHKQQASSSFSTYLAYGVLPVLFAMTGSPALSVVIAIILIAGYIYNTDEVPPTQLHA